MINEGFFADKVVIVEGPSEQYSLPIYSMTLGYDMNRNNVSVVHSEGKGQMDRLLRVFNGFKIPTYLWFDGDKNHKDIDTKKKTLNLLELLGDPCDNIEDVETKITEKYAVLENNFEEMLEEQLDNYDELIQEAKESIGPTGKPLKHRYIADKLDKKVQDGEKPEEVLPKIIIEIIDKIKNVSYCGSILCSDENNT